MLDQLHCPGGSFGHFCHTGLGWLEYISACASDPLSGQRRIFDDFVRPLILAIAYIAIAYNFPALAQIIRSQLNMSATFAESPLLAASFAINLVSVLGVLAILSLALTICRGLERPDKTRPTFYAWRWSMVCFLM